MRTIREEFFKINSTRAYLRGDIFYADFPIKTVLNKVE